MLTETLGVGDNNGDGSLDGNDVPDHSTNPGEVWIAGTVQMTGFKMATGDSNGYVLKSDANGVGTWQAGGLNSSFYNCYGTWGSSCYVACPERVLG